MDIKKGSIVTALAGRDKGSLFVAVGVSDGFVYLANGKTRKCQSPKKKSIKHISPSLSTATITNLTNKQLKKVLSEFKTQNETQSNRNLNKGCKQYVEK